MRPDLDVVASLVPHGARVLDLGCGDGELLEHLIRARGCSGSGIEASADGFLACVARGVPVLQADIDQGLADFADASHDVVIVSQTLQATHKPLVVIREVLRVGRRAIVSFPNMGYWRHRAQLSFGGRMPVSGVLPHAWYDTPNIHLCTLADFESVLTSDDVRRERRIALDEHGHEARGVAARQPNLFAAGVVYLITHR
jgi:methionine biosynthesis protein MetW